MRNPPPQLRQIRRAVWLVAVAAIAGLAGIWFGKTTKARASIGAFAWVHTEGKDDGSWKTLRRGATAEADKGEVLEWVTANQWERLGGPVEKTAPQSRAEPEQLIWLPLLELARIEPRVLTEEQVVVRSPVSVTRFRSPVIDWAATPEKTYDVAIVDLEDENAPPRLLTGVKPPVKLSQLESPDRRPLTPGRMYNTQVRESGKQSTMGVARFLVAEDALDAAPEFSGNAALGEAMRALYKRPFRTGDAWIALSKLSEKNADTEIALRLRYAIALEVGDLTESKRLRRQLLK